LENVLRYVTHGREYRTAHTHLTSRTRSEEKPNGPPAPRCGAWSAVEKPLSIPARKGGCVERANSSAGSWGGNVLSGQLLPHADLLQRAQSTEHRAQSAEAVVCLQQRPLPIQDGPSQYSHIPIGRSLRLFGGVSSRSSCS
jgi:hypothetical protein